MLELVCRESISMRRAIVVVSEARCSRVYFISFGAVNCVNYARHVILHVRSVASHMWGHVTLAPLLLGYAHQVWTHLKRRSFEDCSPFDICCWFQERSV
jgi:hypothetical protein